METSVFIRIQALIFIMAIIITTTVSVPKIRPRVRFVNFGCNYNKDMFKDVVCSYKLARGKVGIFTLAATPVVPFKTAWVKLDTRKKNSANVWRQAKVNVAQDLCKFYEEKNNLFLFFFAHFKESVFDKIVRKCPYTERIELANYTLEQKDADKVLDIFPLIDTTDYLVNMTMSTGSKGEGYIGQLFSVLFVRGNAMMTGW